MKINYEITKIIPIGETFKRDMFLYKWGETNPRGLGSFTWFDNKVNSRREFSNIKFPFSISNFCFIQGKMNIKINIKMNRKGVKIV